MAPVREWSGDEWQAWCVGLIRRTYGADQVQAVPARHGGDLGIEAFTHSGHVFQCYVAEEPLSTKDRYENQRDKLTEDLNKLESKGAEFKSLLGQVRIGCYFFLVPYFNSRQLVRHATTKTMEFLGKTLSILEDNFHIIVTDDDAFPEAKAEAVGRVRQLVDISPIAPNVIDAWISSNEGVVSTVNDKLEPLLGSANKRHIAVSTLMTEYLESDNFLQTLRVKFPQQWEDILTLKARKERRLVLEYGSLSSAHSDSLARIADELATELGESIPSLGDAATRTCAWGAVADWLARCPLDFRDDSRG